MIELTESRSLLRPAPERLEVPMSDGATLSVLRCPSPSGNAPAVVVITPYCKEAFLRLGMLREPLASGYEVLVADVRGFGGSAGPYHGVLSPREIDDGVELLEWISDQPFCDGKTALAGGSYAGMNQLLIAARRPKGLRCIAPWITPADFYRDMWKRGGIPSNATWGAENFINSQSAETRREVLLSFYLDIIDQPYDGELFRRSSPDLAAIEVPAFLSSGWYDFFLAGTIRAFNEVRGPKRLLIGNWGHEPVRTDEQQRELGRWLDFWLRGEGDDPTTPGANVVVSRVQEEGWTTRSAWPDVEEIHWEQWRPVDEPLRIAVQPALRLDLGPDSGMRLWGETDVSEWRVEDEVTLLGPVALKAVIEVNGCRDFDLYARIYVDRGNDQQPHMLTEGRLRASHRSLDEQKSVCRSNGDVIVPWHLHSDGVDVRDAEPVVLNVEIYPISVRVRPGERLLFGLTLVRSDASSEPVEATLLPETSVYLPRERLT